MRKVYTFFTALVLALGIGMATSIPAQAAVVGTITNAQGNLKSSPIIWVSDYYPGNATQHGIYYGQYRKGKSFMCTQPCKSQWGYRYTTYQQIPMSTTGNLMLYSA